MGLLHRTLFTNSDKTEIMRYLREYLNHNNPYEHQLINPETRFQSSALTIPDQIADQMITGSFGENNVATAGNALKVQSIFISDFMTHLGKYLSRTGTEYRLFSTSLRISYPLLFLLKRPVQLSTSRTMQMHLRMW